MSRKGEIIFPILLLGIVVAILAAHPLVDPDLGWNLAGGLWIVENHRIPIVDPLAALGSEWIDYCFLPQVLFGVIFKGFGFRGLLFLQILIPLLTFITAGLFIFSKLKGGSNLVERLYPVVLLAGLLLFIAPIFHLRPQLFSLLLFLCFLIWRERKGSLFSLVIILILWVNTHVYWIFGPVILIADCLIERVFRIKGSGSPKAAFLALLIPILSPYGVKNFLPIFQYSFFHSHVKELIQEFQPLLFTEGYLLPASCVLFSVLVYQAKKSAVSLENLFLTTMFFVLSLWQMKFTPLFGVFSVISLLGKHTYYSRALSKELSITVFAFSVFVSLVYSLYIPAVGSVQSELLEIGKAVSKVNGPVFTQFNAGGWTELGVYLADPNSKAKPWMDGRTLVMGEERLRDYFSVNLERLPFTKYLDENKMEFLVLNRNGRVTPLVYPDRSIVIFETENYLFLRRSLISVNNS